MNCKRCEFSITDIVDVDEGIEVMLLCSFHECLPEDIPEECNVEEHMSSYYDDLFDHNNTYKSRVIAGEEVDAEEVKAFLSDDAVPF